MNDAASMLDLSVSMRGFRNQRITATAVVRRNSLSGVGHGGAPQHGVVDAVQVLGLGAEPALHHLLGVERLDHPQSADGLLDVGEYVAPLVLRLHRLLPISCSFPRIPIMNPNRGASRTRRG